MRERLRTRLLVAIVLVALGVLVVTTVGAATIARETATESAVEDLRRDARHVAAELGPLALQFRQVLARGNSTRAACRLIATTLRVSGGTVVTVRDGRVRQEVSSLLSTTCTDADASLFQLPSGLRVRDLDADRLDAGHRQSGTVDDLAFVAEPLPTALGLGQPVLVLARPTETQPLGRAGGFLVATGAVALVVATLVAAWLARRLVRPIAAMQTTAERIAAGDLSARVDLDAVPRDELGRLARSLDSMAGELEAARGHERTFLLSVSHDLRTPLTSIKGYAEAMSDGTLDSTAERAHAAGVIAAEARRLERLVADLLDLARLDAHQFSLTRRSTDARAVVAATVEGFAPTARDWGLELRVDAGDPLTVDTDPDRLGQIVANLVENALKYARHAVRIEVVHRDGHLEVRVDDDGPGIPVEDRDQVFERLFTARGEPGRSVGTGIGLAIVRELAAAMGGDARYEPLPTGGSRFVVRLPAPGPVS